MTRPPWQDLAEYASKTFIVTSVIYGLTWMVCHKVETWLKRRRGEVPHD